MKKQSEKIREINETASQLAERNKELETQLASLTPPKRDQFESDEAFVSAVMGHNSKLTGLHVEKTRVEGEVKKAGGDLDKAGKEAMAARVDAARERFPDWDTVVQTSPYRLSDHLQYALHMASNGPEIGYMLNKLGADEVARLNNLPWADALQQFSAVESRFAASQKQGPGGVPATPPKPPIEPVGGGGLPPTSGKYKEWEAQRNAAKGPF